MCVHMCAHACVSEYLNMPCHMVEVQGRLVEVGSLLLPCVYSGWNSWITRSVIKYLYPLSHPIYLEAILAIIVTPPNTVKILSQITTVVKHQAVH